MSNVLLSSGSKKDPPSFAKTGGGPTSVLSRDGLIADILWGFASIACLVSLWEVLWALGVVKEAILPPPHIFLANLSEQARSFGSTTAIGSESAGPLFDVLSVMLATALRVLIGLTLGFTVSVVLGASICYFRIFGNLVLPTVTLLAPISPLAWLPVSIFILGVGNAPAIFMVFIAIFFMITLATVNQIERIDVNYLNVAKIMGATKWQTYRSVVLPAILPGLFVILRLNLFGAWMVVLVAEAAGVGNGLGQVINLARNTFNFTLVFLAMTLIGVLGFAFDVLLRQVQTRVLYWVPKTLTRIAI